MEVIISESEELARRGCKWPLCIMLRSWCGTELPKLSIEGDRRAEVFNLS